MKKIINMGYCKFDGEPNRRKAIIEVELKPKGGIMVLSIRGEIKGACYGQCSEEMKKYAVQKRKNFDEIIEVWEKYHLNDMRAGTKRQMAAVRELAKKNKYDYDDIYAYLESKDLLVDDGYRYGSSWLVEEIPSSILDEIFSW